MRLRDAAKETKADISDPHMIYLRHHQIIEEHCRVAFRGRSQLRL